MDCALCYYPNDDEARFCSRCAAALGVPVSRLPTEPPPAPPASELDAADALEAAQATHEAMGSRGGPGPLLGDRYRLLRCLGSGGFGSVYEAEDTRASLRVAIKLLNRASLVDGRMRERFLQEARMIAELRSPHVVVLHDYAVTPRGVPYLVMELLPGQNLSALLMRGVMPARRSALILAQVCAALGEAHAAGMVHRDIKPDNVLLVERPRPPGVGPGEGDRAARSGGSAQDVVKVIDFGVARLCGPMTRASDILGTPAYIAPETLASEPVDGRCDLYAVGIMLWQMIVGELPFPGQNQAVMMRSHLQGQRRLPREVNPRLGRILPDELESLMVRLVARHPGDRPASAYGVRTELLRLAPRLPEAALPPTLVPRPNFGPCWDAPLDPPPPPPPPPPPASPEPASSQIATRRVA